VAYHSGFIESVDQNARGALGTSATRRGDDMHHQRAVVLPEVRRHLEASFLVVTVGSDAP
jgi:hypothetical protein